MRRSRKETDRLRVKGEAKAKFKPRDDNDDPTESMHHDPVPDGEVQNNEQDEKKKRQSKNKSISE
ncbi:hypothetical protein HUG15_09060 [Salicibibacter cibarius]|uniref:Uncharacterized protein n=1 Tax=Salicibibacter cibarius TaxID=2743000 RepID=A0A7T6Z2Q1_9BACI|nr:hypothetical protein [Salicibibacter cibarius]QQK75698.1 hypothetical protein HUG15_09060 [Salicibibacter cibarius]